MELGNDPAEDITIEAMGPRARLTKELVALESTIGSIIRPKDDGH